MSTSNPGRPSHRPRLLTALVLAPLVALACDQEPTDPTLPAVTVDAAAASAADRAHEAATYRVTVHNTAGALQPLTPSVVALHDPSIRIFEVGRAARPEVERVAESGNLEPLTTALERGNHAFDVGVAFGTVDGEPGPILPGRSGSVEVHGPPGLRISVVSMLVCTNDGFTGLQGVRLPRKIGAVHTITTDAYDAGTEQNTESSTDLVPPCVAATTGAEGGTGADQPGIAEDDVIRHHPGIDPDLEGSDILDGRHQWTNPVTRIEIERVE